MPTALHPQAKFDPIPPDLDLHALVDETPNFYWVARLSTEQIKTLGPSGFEKLVQHHVIQGGKPLVIEGWRRFLPESLFNAEWLEKTYDKKQENVRDITSGSDIPMTTGHYLRSMRQLTNQWNTTNYRDERRQRLYLKDIDCPVEWQDHLRKVIPPNVFYMNETVSNNTGIDPRDDDIFGGTEPMPAPAGDLMSSLPEEMRAQNLMCYIGHEGTYTPAHREMCASLGQNIMVEASGDEHGEKPGRSIWFMTETKDKEVVREYFNSMLGHDIDIEKHFAQINAWKKANFPVYVVEQKVGDFILIPSLAPHQVWNCGTRTMKVAWNRTTVETLNLALHEALPKARLVCRDEQYKNKAIVLFTLNRYYRQLQKIEEKSEVGFLGLGRELSYSPRSKQLANDFRQLFDLFSDILIDEMFGYKHTDVEFIEFDSNITCSYCRSNIFNRFLTCKCCVRTLINGDEDTYDICMECYAMGRSCACISMLQWCEQWRWSDLVEKHETWRAMVIRQDGFVDIDHSPQPLEVARKKSGKKSVAQICQEQLWRRPWKDISKPDVEVIADESEHEPEIDDEGRVKKKAKSKRKAKEGEVYRCHVCCHKHDIYKLNYCTTCQEAYCYGVLWRAFDIMPQDAMEEEHWRCPKCLGICNCGTCRRLGNTKPYVPKNTLLGHDTRKIADDRSVESIVDFRVHNLSWLKAAGEENRSKDSKRMQKLKEQADAEKAKDPIVSLDVSIEDESHEMRSTLQNSISQNFDHRSQALDTDSSPVYSGEASNGNVYSGKSNRVPTANMSGNHNGEELPLYPDPSMYPDPSIGVHMMGMGFYDQDDSADRILFDAFQAPSADPINGELEVSEFVKKTLRRAKRKARLENEEDPHFLDPRSHHQKRPRVGNLDQLVNLDPALLGALGNISSSATGTPARPDTQPRSLREPGAPDGDDELPESALDKQRPKSDGQSPLMDPLRPTLGHPKSPQSYVEPEEPIKEIDDIAPVHSLKLFGAQDNDNQITDENEIDLAAEAIRTLAEHDVATEPPVLEPRSTTQQPPETTEPQGKRRGRPPGRPPRSIPSASAPASATKEPPSRPKRRVCLPRGAPVRGSQLSNANSVDSVEDTPMAGTDYSQNDGDSMIRSLATGSRTDLARGGGQDDSGKAKSAKAALKRRGRPPGRKSMPAPTANSHPVRAPVQTHYMSMAERMAAQGRKIKIRTRSKEGVVSSPAVRSSSDGKKPGDIPMSDIGVDPLEPISGRGTKDLLANDFEEPEAVSPISDVLPEPPHKKASGPTVVRLSDGDDSANVSESESEFDSEYDDEGIPAKKSFVAIRGGGWNRLSGIGRA